jgi:hypothetical protein
MVLRYLYCDGALIMENFLKLSTATTVLIGPFLDDTNFKDAETGLTILNTDVYLSKNGGAMGAKNNGTTCVADLLGYYTCQLSTTDTGTIGVLKLMVHVSGALPVTHTFQVVSASVYDSLFAADGTEYLPVNIKEINSGASSPENLNNMFNGTGYTHSTAPATQGVLGGIETDVSAIVPDISAIKSKTDGLVFSLEDSLDVNVVNWANSPVVLPDSNGYPIVTIKRGAGAGELDIDSGKINAMITSDSFDPNSITLDAFSSEAISRLVNAIWDEVSTSHLVSDTFGQNIYTLLSNITAIKTATDNMEFVGNDIKATLDSETVSLSEGTMGEIWDEPKSAHTTSGSFGDLLDRKVSTITETFGTGSLECTYTLTLSDDGSPISNATVLVTTDSTKINVVASATTNMLGVVYLNLDSVPLYIWRYKAGVNFTNPILVEFSRSNPDAYGTGVLADVKTTSRVRTATYVGSS